MNIDVSASLIRHAIADLNDATAYSPEWPDEPPWDRLRKRLDYRALQLGELLTDIEDLREETR